MQRLSRAEHPELAPVGPPRRVTLVFWLLGVALLAGTVAGGVWLLRPSEPPPPPAPPGEGLPVVCIGYVDVPDGVAGLAPLQNGRIAELPVPEGEVVPAGTVLLKLDDRLARAAVREAEKAVEAARLAEEEAKKAAELHPLKVAQQESVVEAARRRVLAAKHLYEHRTKLRELKQVSEAELAAAQEQVRELEALEQAARGQLAELKRADPGAPARQAAAEAEVLEAKLEQARQALEQFVVRAPARGRILRRVGSVGDLTGPAAPQPPLFFVPDQPPVVRAEVDQEFIGRLREGMFARVRDDIRPDSPTWT
ncbi:MAG TPA: biotin/lipoyl-binding protein, partial [Gemmataceae bacterium]